MTTYPPAPTDDGRLRPLDLAQRKDLGPLMTSAWRLWRARPSVFLSSALVIAFVPVAILTSLQFLWDDRGDATASSIASVSLTLLEATVITWLITATHVRAVLAFASGEDIPRDEALRRGMALLGAVAGAAVVLFLAVFGGLLLILIPGIYIAVAGMFATIVPAVGEQRGWAAVKESIRIVRASGWWLTLGTVFVIQIVASVAAIIPALVFGVIGGVIMVGNDVVGAIVVGIGLAVVEVFVLSWSALAYTLLFFSHRARIGEPWQPPAGTRPLDIAVGPGGGVPANQPGAQWGQPVSGSEQQQPASPSGSTNPIFTKPGQAPLQPQAPNDEPPHFEPPR